MMPKSIAAVPTSGAACTFHDYSARSPDRAATVRAHDWVVVGALLPRADQPAYFLPTAGLLYFRKTQLPAPQGGAAHRLPRQVWAARRTGPAARRSLYWQALAGVRRRLRPSRRGPSAGRIGRAGAAAYRVPDPAAARREAVRPAVGRAPAWRGGPPPKYGRRLPPPRQGGRRPGPWQAGRAFICGRERQVRYEGVLCLWRVLGHDVVVEAVAAGVEGCEKRFTLVGSATEPSGLQLVELFRARPRREDGFRDPKRGPGWGECRAWTRNPIGRTTQTRFATMTGLRPLRMELQAEGGDGWRLRPPWDPGKTRPGVLDAGRLRRRHGEGIRRCLADWPDGEGNSGD